MNRNQALFSGIFLLGALSLYRPQAPTQAPGPVEVPVGGIILWWGPAADIPEGFEACDGTIVTTRNAVLRGAKPNLQSKFPRGAANYRTFVPQAYAGGGSDELALSIEDHVLTKDQLPAHAHKVGPLAHVVSIGGKPQGNSLSHSHPLTLQTTGGSSPQTSALVAQEATTDYPLTTESSGGTLLDHPPTSTTSEGRSGPISLKHKLTQSKLDNRPAYVEVVFLIRVK